MEATVNPQAAPFERHSESIVRSAIGNWRLIGFTYKGSPRVVEAHTFGILRNGRSAVCGYEVGSGARRRGSGGWKTFYLSDMRGIVELEKTFDKPRPGYRKGDRGFTTVLCEL
ncbi:hypothetical protein BH24PSE2_BH24PSE2_17030 [soil metagenome]